MLKDISKMEQRYDAVTMVMRDGFSITDIAAKFNVSRQTVYRWLAKYEEGGLEALADESHRLTGHHLAGKIHHRGDFGRAREEGNAEIVDFEDRIHRRQSRSDCSRSASASRLSPRTNDIIASAGGRAGWMNSRMNRLDSLIIVPQSGLSGGMPSPK